MRLKAGVSIVGAVPELVLGLQVAESVFAARSIPLMITSLADGVHRPGSLHYRGAAADLRLASRWTGEQKDDFALLDELRAALGPEFDVILEADHFHLEVDAIKRRHLT